MPEKLLETRPATADDFEYVWSVYEEVVKPHIEPKKKEGWIQSHEKKLFQGIWNPEESYVITVNNEPIGWGAARISGNEVTIVHLYVEPRDQQKGYGSRLTSELVKKWNEEGKTVYATVLKDARVAALAERLSFKKIKGEELTDLMQFQA